MPAAALVPDFVTLGKPMANGHPVAGVITRRDIVSSLAGRTTLFSTCGGNPVSGPRAQAVRDRMRHLGVLVGSTGPHRNVLKIRPPLALTEAHVPTLAEAFATAVSSSGPAPRSA